VVTNARDKTVYRWYDTCI